MVTLSASDLFSYAENPPSFDHALAVEDAQDTFT